MVNNTVYCHFQEEELMYREGNLPQITPLTVTSINFISVFNYKGVGLKATQSLATGGRGPQTQNTFRK